MSLTKFDLKFFESCFLDMKNSNPFVSSEIYDFLGFSRHSNFKKFLNKKSFSRHLIFSDNYTHKINSRSREIIMIDRELFYKIVYSKYPHIHEFGKFYAAYKKEVYKEKILRFTSAKERNSLKVNIKYQNNLYGDFKGEMYLFSLNTLNYALAIDYDPFLMYKYYHLDNDVLAYRCKLADLPISYPYAYFDHQNHYQRLKYLNFLDLAFKQLELTPLQKQFHLIYVELITELLEKQKNLDLKYGRLKVKASDIELTKRLKEMYRFCALKCHPDKGGDQELFKKLNNANEKSDIFEVERIYNKLKK